MSKIYLNGKICFRRDTKVNWETNNPILKDGEIGVVTDGISSQRIKIGDGTNYWNDLEWVQTADLVYDGDSENAQSGVALKSIFADKQDKFATVNIGTDCELSNLKPISFTSTVKVLTPAASSNPATKKYVDDKSALKVDKVTGKGLSTNDYDAAEKAKVASAVQPADLADVATSGSYNDLTDTPTIDITFSPTSENVPTSKAIAQVFSESLKGTKYGNSLFRDDISSIQHPLKVIAWSKNKFNINNIVVPSGTTVSKTSTSVTITSDSQFNRFNAPIPVKKGESITFRASIQRNVATGTSAIQINDLAGVKVATQNVPANTNTNDIIINYTSPKDETLEVVFYSNYGTTEPFIKCTYSNIQIVTGTYTASNMPAYTPFIDDLTLYSVKRYGKNLFNGTWYRGILNEDGTVTTDTIPAYSDLIPVSPNTQYTLSQPVAGVISLYVLEYNNSGISNGTVKGIDSNTDTFVSFITGNDTYFVKLKCRQRNGSAFGLTNKAMLSMSTNTTYSDYIVPQTVTIDSNGTVSGLTSVAPDMTLFANNKDITLKLEYNKDINITLQKLTNAIITLGGTLNGI